MTSQEKPKKPLKLLKLPFAAMEKVMKQMDKMDLLELSFTSKKTTSYIRLLREFVDEYHIKHTANEKTIQLQFADGKKIKWKFLNPLDFAIQLLDKRNVKHITYFCKRVNETMTAQTRNKAYGDLFILKILEHIVSIFPGNITDFNVELQKEGNDFLRLFVKDLGFVENLTLSGVPDAQMIKFVVGQLMVGTKLEIQQQLDERVTFDFTNVPELVVQWSGAHFNKGELSTLNSRFCHLKNSRLGTPEIIHFLEDFMNMKTKSGMGWLRFEFMNGIDTVHIRNWIRLNKGTEQHVARDYVYSQFHSGKYEEIDTRLAGELVRPDGLLLTVVEMTGVVRIMNIIVWQDRFPRTKNIKKQLELVPKYVQCVGERNRLRDRNYRKIMECEKQIIALEADTARLEAETAKMRDESVETEKLRQQLQRLQI